MGELLSNPGIWSCLREAGPLHPQSAACDAAEEVEEAEEVPTHAEAGRIRPVDGPTDLDEDEPLAIGI